MEIELNHRSEHLAGRDQVTIAELLAHKRYAFPNIVVRVNGRLVRKGEYPSTVVREGDKVEMIHMVSGG